MQLSEKNTCGIHIGFITLFFHTRFFVLDTLASTRVTSHYTEPPSYARYPLSGQKRPRRTWQSTPVPYDYLYM